MSTLSWAEAIEADLNDPRFEQERLENESRRRKQEAEGAAMDAHLAQQLEAQNPEKFALERLTRENQELRARLEALEQRLGQ